MGYTRTDHINFNDDIMIVQDGCIKVISLENFLHDFYLGGFDICEAIKNCNEGIGGTGTIDPTDRRPTMRNLIIPISELISEHDFSQSEFEDKYFDADGDDFGKIIIIGGNTTNFRLNGNPVYVGQSILKSELSNLKYRRTADVTSYQQELLFDTYDVNNVKAVAI